MVHSMTGFASESGTSNSPNGSLTWTIEMRGVNAKGLDVRVRAPDRMVGLDQKLKARLQKGLSRGNVSVSVRVDAENSEGATRVDEAVLDGYLAAAKLVQDKATTAHLSLSPPSATDFLSLRGVMATGDDADSLPSEDEILETADQALSAFVAMRASEGAALQIVLDASLDQVSTLVRQAADLAAQRKDKVAQALRVNLARVLDNSDGADPDRVAQELAMLAVKADVTEEIDRLDAHVDAARELLGANGAVGRKLDFLMQEFNREANTLCSKSGSTELTRVGLDLKALIDQMREQVQNVE